MSKFSRFYKSFTIVIIAFLCLTLIPAFIYNLKERNIENLILMGITFLLFSAIDILIYCCFNHYCDAIRIEDDRVYFFLLNGKQFVAPVRDVRNITCRWDRYIFDLQTKKIYFLKRPFLFGKPNELTELYYFYNATIRKD